VSGRFADLHLHTTASDGTQSVTEVARRASALGLSVIAITDHDTISPDLTEREARIEGIDVITGVEIKADFNGVRGELLGYFVDPESPGLRSLFAFMQRVRRERMAQMVELCRERLRLEIAHEEVLALASGSVGRPHLARLLVDKGVVGSPREAFDRLLAKGRPCYVPLDKPSVREAAEAIHAAGGATSIAHPCLMDVEDWERFLKEAHAAGADAVEGLYPYAAARGALHISPASLTALARKEGFLLTGGSDDHGPGSVKESFGVLRIPLAYVQALREVCRPT